MRLGQHVDLTVVQYVDMRVLLYISQFQQLSPHPKECAIQGEQNANALG